MVLHAPGTPLSRADVPRPRPGPGQVLARVSACAVCRTDLHVVDGELRHPKLPLVPGHEIVARVAERGPGAERFRIGDRIGIPWLAWTCGSCAYCRSGRENLCPQAKFTGYTVDGGYAEFAVADERFAVPLPDDYGDAEAAPLLCAGLIGFRSLRKAGEGKKLGLYGFGAAAHIVAQLAVAEGREVHAVTRRGDDAAQEFARSLGAAWVGDAAAVPDGALDAAILFAPVGALVPEALRATAPGGCVVCGGIHMSDIPSFPYRLLWEERSVASVANLTRADADAFFAAASRHRIRTRVQTFPLAEANAVLDRLRRGEITGAAVLVPPTE